MRSKIIIFAVILSIMPFSYIFASEYRFGSDINVTGKLTDIDGNKAKFNEYRDTRDGVYGRIRFVYDSEKYYLDVNAYDIGYKTQNYALEGGKWGSFKYYFEYDEIPHNFTFGAKSFYSGLGTNNLTFPIQPPGTDISIWNTFDYSIARKNLGGGLKLNLLKPFYFDVYVSKEEKEGIFPVGLAGTTPGGIAVELPEPIDYTTDTLKLEAGYAKKPVFLSLSYLYSEFENSNSNLNFRNPATANTASTTDIFTLPPDNRYYKLALKGTLKLPLNSKFNLNLASSRTKSEADIFDFFVDDVPGGRVPITISNSIFHGKIDTVNYAFVLTSNPVAFFESKFFYKYYRRKNKSDEITTVDGAETFINPLFGYRNDGYGVELGFRLPMRFHLSTAYNHVRTKREREDVPRNKDNIYSIELKWSGLDFITLRAGYEKLHRSAEFHVPDVAPDDPDFIETFVRRFDVAAKDRDTYKASVDIFPIENLNLSIGFKDKNTNYKDVILGLRQDKRYEFNIDGDYTIGKLLKITAYYDLEKVKYFQFQRQMPFNATTGFDPAIPPTTNAFNWEARQKDKSCDYGVGTDIYLVQKKLTLKLLYDYVRSDGTADFTYLLGANPLPAGRTQDNIDISNWDDYRLRSYVVKAVYSVTGKLSFSAGYGYEKFTYSDAQLDGYQFVPAVTGTNGAFLTGAYKDQSYRASIVFFGAAYRF